MKGPLRLLVGDRVRLRKPHPCGGVDWEVVRVGADIKAKCCTCGRLVMLARPEFERRVKTLLTAAAQALSDKSSRNAG